MSGIDSIDESSGNIEVARFIKREDGFIEVHISDYSSREDVEIIQAAMAEKLGHGNYKLIYYPSFSELINSEDSNG